MLRLSVWGVGAAVLGLWFGVAAAACGSDDTTPPAGGACGDGVVDATEGCDDGNLADGDGCSRECAVESATCGNGKVEAGEGCDDGNLEDGDGCSQDCSVEGATCGDGKVDPGEACDDGNLTAGDGCEPDCTETPNEIVCAMLPPLAEGNCEVTPGNASGTLLVGDVLLPTVVLKGGQVAVNAAGTIVCVGCDCAASAAGMARVTCPEAVISPALINSHDHITFQSAPKADSGERYEHRHDWRLGKNGHTKISSGGTASKALMQNAEIRHLLGGATSTIGSGGTAGMLRNLDRSNDLQELLGQTPVNYQTFPLGDSDGTMLDSGCGYSYKDTAQSIAMEDAYYPHVSEGINAAARNEFLCSTSSNNGGQDLAAPQSAFIHSIGLGPVDYAVMAAENVSLIWSPRSNIRLYGDTAQVTTASRLGVPIALGTDWLPSGSMNILRELRCADEYNTTHLDGFFKPRDLWRMVTDWAAQAAAVDDVVGVLDEGKVADVAIFSEKKSSRYRAVIDARPEDVVMVMRGGKVLYGDDAIVTGLGASSCDPLDVCGSSKRVCASGEFGATLSAINAAAANAYPLFFCEGMGSPTDEPSCTPSRPKSVLGSTVYTGAAGPMDVDGDGIADGDDNCPKVFNPIRPLDGGQQADADQDGAGDPCDVCPLDAGKEDCEKPNPDDVDGDGVVDTDDNCAGLKNPDQADTDMDGKGDACDPCPMTANPGSLACPVSIYDVKKGVVMVGAKVGVQNALVTACRTASGYFLQVKAGDAGYKGVEHSGIYVYDPKVTCGSTVSVGDRVDVNPATVSTYHGAIELSAPTAVKLSSGEALPAPHVVSASDASTATALDGVLATIASVKVLDVTPKPSFVVTGPLTVGTLLFQPAYFPVLDEGYDSITGVLAVYDATMRVLPRQEADLAIGPPVLVALSPSPTFAKQGQTAAETFPQALTITLSRKPSMNVLVNVASSNGAVVRFGGQAMNTITVPAGSETAKVLVDAPALGAATITASKDGLSRTASVTVINDSLVRSVKQVTPAAVNVHPNTKGVLTIELDMPAPGPMGSTVTLAVAPGTFVSVPPTVTIPANALTATVEVTAGPMLGAETLTASLGASMKTASVVVKNLSGLVINEIDYDTVGTDLAEWVEIFNGTGGPYDLANHALVLVNGSTGQEYARFDMSALGVLPADGYVVLGSDLALTLAPAGTMTVSFGGNKDYVQNGAPDAAAIVNTSTNVIVDALSYEGSITMAVLLNFPGPVSCVEGMALGASVADSNTVLGSLVRFPNGVDTQNAANDWVLSSKPTPGAANVTN